MAIVAKLREYGREIVSCFQLADSLVDGARLSVATMAFHAANLVGSARATPARRYSMRIGGRLHEVWMRTVAGDMFVLHEVFGGHCYQPEATGEVKTVVDLGANIGLTSLYLSTYFPNARYICVEPNPENAQLLRRNLARLDAVVVQAAASDTTGTVYFDVDRPSWGGMIVANGSVAVPAISIGDLLSAHAPHGRIGLLKMDIEGGEAAVMTGALGWLDRVDCMMIEIHTPYSLEQFSETMMTHGFHVGLHRGMITATRYSNGK